MEKNKMRLSSYKQIIIIISGAIIVSLVLLINIWLSERNKENVEVIFLDVGQGDSILIKTKYNQQILIDAGPDAKVLSQLGRHMPFWDNDLDLVIITHPDADHIGGLPSVLGRYSVDLILEDGIIRDSNIYKALDEIIKQKQIQSRVVAERERYDLGDNLFLDILYPNKNFANQDPKDDNTASVVAKLTDGAIDYLFTGDAPVETEKSLINIYGAYLDSEILKLGHHGSNTSTDKEFLNLVKPEVSVISVGRDNRYGHPHQTVLNILSKLSIPTLRTDEIGDIKMVSNGEFVELR